MTRLRSLALLSIMLLLAAFTLPYASAGSPLCDLSGASTRNSEIAKFARPYDRVHRLLSKLNRDGSDLTMMGAEPELARYFLRCLQSPEGVIDADIGARTSEEALAMRNIVLTYPNAQRTLETFIPVAQYVETNLRGQNSVIQKVASSAESVGELRLRQPAKVVI